MLSFAWMLACPGSPPVDTGEPLPGPWHDLAPRALEPLHPLLHAPLNNTVSPSHIALMPGRPQAFVLDSAAGRVHVLDDRYRHQRKYHCLDAATNWPAFPVTERQQAGCEAGQVMVERGGLETPGAAPLAMALDPDGLRVFVWAGGRVFGASADLLHEDPWEVLRLDDGVVFDVPAPEVSAAMAWGDGALWLGSDRWLGRFAVDGSVDEQWQLPGDVTALVSSGDRLWAAVDGGAWSEETGLVAEGRIAGLAADGVGGVWASVPDEDRVVHLGADGPVEEVALAGLEGPVALDRETGRLYLGLAEAVVVVEDGVDLARREVSGVVDLAVAPTHEVAVLTSEQAVEVLGDEQALAGGDPLNLMIATFVENPKSPDSDAPCLREETGIDANLRRALRNRVLLDDLPIGVALGVTPHLARRAVECALAHDLYAVVEGERIEVGVLNHETPDEDCAADPECHARFLSDQTADVAISAHDPTWMSGLVAQEDLGVDWVQSLLAAGDVDTYLHFSLALRPDIDQGQDPRSKQPYPPDVADLVAPLLVDDLSGLEGAADEGSLRLLPGNSIAAYRLSACPNLWLWECNTLSAIDAKPWLEPEDIEVLSLLVFRALAVRRSAADTWMFHLPDLASWDYTAECKRTERLWHGEECQGALLQEWVFDLHAAYVEAGLVRWSLPSEVAWP